MLGADGEELTAVESLEMEEATARADRALAALERRSKYGLSYRVFLP